MGNSQELVGERVKEDVKGRPGLYDRTRNAFSEMSKEVDTELLAEKEQVIEELKETISIMELKIRKLEELLAIKDNKIQTLTNKLSQANIKS